MGSGLKAYVIVLAVVLSVFATAQFADAWSASTSKLIPGIGKVVVAPVKQPPVERIPLLDSVGASVVISPINYASQPSRVRVRVTGGSFSYPIDLVQGSRVTRLGNALNGVSTEFQLPYYRVGSQSFSVRASLQYIDSGILRTISRDVPLTFEVTRTIPVLRINAKPGTTVASGTTTQVECFVPITSGWIGSQVTPRLMRAGRVVSNPERTVLSAGSHDYSCTSAETQNFTAATAAPLTIIVTADSVTPTATTVTINGIDADQTTNYGDGATLAASTTGSSVSLYLDGRAIPNPSLLGLAAGRFNVSAFTRADVAHSSSSAMHWLNVNRATPMLSISIAPTSTVVPGTETRVQCTASASEITPRLTRDGALVSNPDVATLASGSYNYACTSIQTQNYTAATAAPATLIVDSRLPTITMVTINGFNSDRVIDYGDAANLAASTTGSAVTLYLNGTVISNPSLLVLRAGLWNVSAFTRADVAHSSSSAMHWLTVNKAAPVLSIEATPSDSVTYGTATNVRCTASSTQVSPRLTRDAVGVSNPHAATLNAGTYEYACTSIETQNYSAAAAAPLMLRVARATPSITISLNGEESDLSVEIGTRVTIASTLSVAGDVTLTENDAVISSGASPRSVARTPVVAGVLVYNASFAGNDNYASAYASRRLTVTDSAAPIASGAYWNYTNGTLGQQGMLNWVTDRDATSTVYYWNTTRLLVTNATSTRTHNQTLYDLQPDSLYHYIIESCDARSNCTNTSEATFRTPVAFELVRDTGLDFGVIAMQSFSGRLYLGTYNYPSSTRAKIVSTDGSTYRDEVVVNDRFIRSFGVLDGKLFAGTGLDYGQLYRRNADGSWNNLVNFTVEGDIRSIAEYNYADPITHELITLRFLGMKNGTIGTRARILYSVSAWGNDAAWDIYWTVSANAVNSFTVFNNQLYAGLNGVGFEDVWCNKNYYESCDAYRTRDVRANSAMNLLTFNSTVLLESSSLVPSAFQKSNNALAWQDTFSGSSVSSIPLLKAGTKAYGAGRPSGTNYYTLIYESSDGGATWKSIFAVNGSAPVFAEFGGKIYLGANAEVDPSHYNGVLYRST